MKIRKAFTILEVLLGLTISATVMFGCTSLMFNMISLTERLEGNWSLKTHADGVERFFRSTLSTSQILYPTKFGSVYSSNSTGLCLSEPPETPDGSGTVEYCLAFEMNGQHPIFPAALGFSHAKLCYLLQESKCTSIIWRYANPEEKNATATTYKTVISQHIEKITYFYNDEVDGWVEEDEIDTTTADAFPEYMKLYFKYGDEKVQRIITLKGFIDDQI